MSTTTAACPDCGHPDKHTPLIGCLHAEGDGNYCPCTTKWEPSAPLPELPYAGTSGWSGSQASRERAEAADTDGTTKGRQKAALAALGARGNLGLTWKELADRLGLHHGQASGVLSGLHKAGRIARLATGRRQRSSVYVLPEYVEGRTTAPHGGRPKHADVNVPRSEPGPVVTPVAALEAHRHTAEAIVAKHLHPLSPAPSYTVQAAARATVDDLIALGY